eukprot:g758.t1
MEFVTSLPSLLLRPRVQLISAGVWGVLYVAVMCAVVNPADFEGNSQKEDCEKLQNWLRILCVGGLGICILMIINGVIDFLVESARERTWPVANYVINPLGIVFYVVWITLGWTEYPIESSNEDCGNVGEWCVGLLMWHTGCLAFVGGCLFFAILTWSPFCAASATGSFGAGAKSS